MTKKKFILIPIILIILFFIFSLPCHGNLVCTGPANGYLGYPFLWFLALIPLSLFALVLKEIKHRFWLKFTGIFFVVSMILVFLTPEYGSGIVSLDRELVNWFFAGIYSFVSIIYFIVQFVKSRKN